MEDEQQQHHHQQQPFAAASLSSSGGSAPSQQLQLLLPQSFVVDPATFLASIASQAPSHHSLAQLAGPVAAWFIAASPASELVANVYLQAASVQLRDLDDTGSTATSGSTAAAVKTGTDVEQEMIRTQQQYEVLEAVSAAASQCVTRRMAITSSGILPTLAHLIRSTNSHQHWNTTTTTTTPNHNQNQNDQPLQHASADFLHCALLAEQYRYAARIISGTWPRPTATVSAKQVLRYYYLRGMIHLGCNDYTLAHRCFWTCLSVPAEVCSQIMMEAWKKLILVQCLLLPTSDNGNDINSNSTNNSKNTRLPKTMPNCMGRRLASLKEKAAAASSPSNDLFPGSSSGKRSARHPQRPAPPQQLQQQQLQQQQSQQHLPPVQFTTCYMELVEAFYKRDKAKMEALQTEHRTILLADGNDGLVQQCHSQLVRNQVAHLSKMYSVVSLSKLAQLLQISKVEEVTTILCQSGVLCEIQEDGMVVFADTTNSTTTTTTTTNTSNDHVDLTEWMQLLDKVQKLDVGIATTAKYHSLMRKESSGGGDAKAAAAGPRGVEDF